MKKRLLLVLLAISLIFISGCAQQYEEKKEPLEPINEETNMVVEEATAILNESPPIEEAEIPEQPAEPEIINEIPERVGGPESVVDTTSSWPLCTEDQFADCDSFCNIPENIPDDSITSEQNVCYETCLVGKKCRNVPEGVELENVHNVIWAGHNFEVAQLRSADFKSDGIVEWTDNGFIAHDYSLPRAKLLDVNMNQKIKIKVIANMEGRLDSDVPDCKSSDCSEEYGYDYPFAEFPLYFVDSRDSYEIKYGIALIGTEESVAKGNIRDTFKAGWFSIENTGKKIIFEDSSGRKIVNDENSDTEHKLSELNQNDEWRLRINSHVNGEGYAKLEINEIQIIK